MANAYLIVSIVVAVLSVAVAGAYFGGYLDADSPWVKPLAKYYFKTKAKAQEKAMQAKGLKEGQDFMKDQLEGNKQAADVQKGLGGLKDL
ncbi:MAG: hypothetical protein M1833_004033 [Piccolia ochrophora]|nr:MAG: hypothetical protein M1833_004033 [Piccolia ochrophora]